MSNKKNRAVIEALLFAASRPLTAEILSEASGWDKKQIVEAVEGLKGEYEAQGRGFTLDEVAGGFQLRSDPRFADQVSRLFTSRSRRRFTRSSLETLSIIAYRQPVTKAEIEQIRGVDSGGVLKNLLSQVMIRVLGRKEAPGRPILYGSTREFLEYFGLRDIESLPTLEEVAELLEENELQEPGARSQEPGETLTEKEPSPNENLTGINKNSDKENLHEDSDSEIPEDDLENDPDQSDDEYNVDGDEVE